LDELRLCLVTDRAQVRGRDLVGVVVECLAAGLPAVQVREKDLSAAELAALCRRLRKPTRERRALLIVNDRADVALAVGADAVQRTHSSLAVAEIREIVDKRLRIGASTHAPEEALAAEAEGADWIVFGPVYDTPSKRRYGAPQGLRALEAVVAAVRIPVIAIGGIAPERVPEVRRAGAHGVAVISALLTATSPGDATKRFLESLSSS
jgi:thiamine-phosphate pyrophosphorylase